MPKTMTIAKLRSEIAAREKQLAKLQARRKAIAKKLVDVDREVTALSGKAIAPVRKPRKKAMRKIAAKKGRRARAQPSLADVLAEVLVGKGNVRVAEAAKLALGAGYKSRSSQFGNIVSQALSVDKRFRKIARGVYVLRRGGKAAVTKSAKKVAKKTARAGKKAGPQKSLGDLLAEVAKGRKLLGVADAARLVLEKGYKSQAANFQLAVNKALMRDERFGRVSRGVYTLKGREGGTPEKVLGKPARKTPKKTAAKGSKTTKKAMKKGPERKRPAQRTASKAGQKAPTPSP